MKEISRNMKGIRRKFEKVKRKPWHPLEKFRALPYIWAVVPFPSPLTKNGIWSDIFPKKKIMKESKGNLYRNMRIYERNMTRYEGDMKKYEQICGKYEQIWRNKREIWRNVKKNNVKEFWKSKKAVAKERNETWS